MKSAYATFSLKGCRSQTAISAAGSYPAPPGMDATGLCDQGAGGHLKQICWEYEVRRDFWLSVVDFHPTVKTVLNYTNDHPMVSFGFVLDGHFTNKLRSSVMGSVDFLNMAGFSGILYLPRRDGEIHVPPQKRVRILHVHMSAAVFHDLFARDADTIPRQLGIALNGSSRRSYSFRGEISLPIQAILLRILEGTPSGIPRHLFFEGAALKLVAHQIGLANNQELTRIRRMESREKERVIAAADLLTRDLISPPGLRELSGKVGLSINKLQQGFREIFGMSVFEYLRTYKMRQASRLFHETDMNVSQTAWEVGYTNVSHFSAAYKKAFGVPPKKYLQEIRNQPVVGSADHAKPVGIGCETRHACVSACKSDGS